MSPVSEAAPRVLLVSPKFNDNAFWGFEAACELQGAKCLEPPLGLITLAAMLPTAWNLRLIDRNADHDLTDADVMAADLVMAGGMLPQEPDLRAIVARCNRLGVPVCLGGPAPTSTPENYETADFIVVGEAEDVIGQFIDAWERGERAGRIIAPKFKADVTRSPIPRFDLLDFRDYLMVNVQFSRGCPFTCEFCDIIELYGRAPRTKATPQMLAELDRLMALGYRGHVDFVDDNLIGNKKAVKAFLPHLIEWQKANGYPFKFSTEASLNLADDPELLRLMRRAYFFAVFVGIESPDEDTLKQTQKKQNTRRSIADSVHRIYKAGIFVNAGFIVGFDTETKSVARAMADCIGDTSIPTAVVGLLTALPNTQLQRRLKREGRLFDFFRKSMTESGDMCTAGLNFTTLRPRREILKDCRDVVAEVYSPAAYFGRVRRLSRILDTHWPKARKLWWRTVPRDAMTFLRLLWSVNVRHPEMARHFWAGLYDVVRHNPGSYEGMLRNTAHFVHLYPFSQYLVRTFDARIADLDQGRWDAPPLLPAGNDDACTVKPLAAVA
ncbi:B12-binding domain-containing radical SAM protein [Methylobacterium haplocladii]|uniref:B12-binding domain-containing radical SAM protein n=1 Tax=Methylobacterium haplocladii TaxID=1176176 RepID=A0A512IP44_9HYPH|nr:B12-binding domain-containing radical SAM protein [Methylobacterium haplocladii]GJD83236.1 Hopanoid C-2 methylase [Methylobacterium haplocladii]GLS60630.1 B12-binding domain-containing radical SAM protein [Methylobacterium haplocladii]